MKLFVRVLPRSSKNEIVGEMPDGTLKVKLTAPPIGGQANKALIELMSKKFNVPKNKITILKGLLKRNKLIEIA